MFLQKMNPAKKSEMQQCRTCYVTTKALKRLTDLTKCGESEQLTSFAEILHDVCGINIMEDLYKELPQFICEACARKLKAAHTFIQQSHEVNGRLMTSLSGQKDINFEDSPVVVKMEYDESVLEHGLETPWQMPVKEVEDLGFEINHLNGEGELNEKKNICDNDTMEMLKNSKEPPNNTSQMNLAQMFGLLHKKLDLLADNHELFKNQLKDIKNQNCLVLNVLSENTDFIEKSLNKNPKYVKIFPLSTLEDLKEIEENINDSNEKEYVSSIRAIAGHRGLKKGLADIMSPKLLVDFNVDGSHNKLRLLNYPKFVNALFNGTYDENCTEKSFKCHLRDALKLVKNRYFKEKLKCKEKDSSSPKENITSNDGDMTDVQ